MEEISLIFRIPLPPMSRSRLCHMYIIQEIDCFASVPTLCGTKN